METITEKAGRKDPKTEPWSIKAHLQHLKKYIDEEPPVSSSFFEQLIDARDSVIHANARAEWTYQDHKRAVAKCYQNGSDLEITEAQLKEAFTKAVEMAEWYEKKLPVSKRS